MLPEFHLRIKKKILLSSDITSGGKAIMATENSNSVSPNVVYFHATNYFLKVGVTFIQMLDISLWNETCFICKLLVIVFKYLPQKENNNHTPADTQAK